jgi:hypothetical protein
LGFASGSGAMWLGSNDFDNWNRGFYVIIFEVLSAK